MSSIEFRPEDRDDLNEIWEFIAKDSPTAATRWVDTIEDKCRTVSDYPDMGRSRNDLEPGIQVFPVGKYAVCYRAIPNGIEIVRVLHFSRDIEALFESP
jgi:toxin ParE1/3/4